MCETILLFFAFDPILCLCVETIPGIQSCSEYCFCDCALSNIERYLQQHDEVELSALGMAIATVVTVAEILKNNGLAIEKRILTSTVEMKDETREWPIQKAKVEIILTKADKFDELMVATSEEREFGGEEDVHR